MSMDDPLLCPVCRQRELKVELSFTCRHRYCFHCLISMYDPVTEQFDCTSCKTGNNDGPVSAPMQVSPEYSPPSSRRGSLGLIPGGLKPQYSDKPEVLLYCKRPTENPNDHWWLHMTVHKTTNHLYVSDRENCCIRVIFEGRVIREFGTKGTGRVQFLQPRDLCINRLNQLLVADCGNHRIQVLTLTGDFIYQIGTEGTGDCNFFYISGVSVWGDMLCVTDYRRLKVLSLDKKGIYQFRPERDVAQNTFGALSGISMSAEAMWISDYHYRRIYRFSPGGDYIGQLENRELWPRGCTPDRHKLLHLGDKSGRRIVMVGQGGTIVEKIQLEATPGSICFLNDGATLVYTVMNGNVGEVHKRERINEFHFSL